MRLIQINARHSASWRKWPDTMDTDYEAILAERSFTQHTLGNGLVVIVEHRTYPVYLPYILCNQLEALIPPYPGIDNREVHAYATQSLALAGLAILRRQCAGAQILVWDHARQCYPQLAAALSMLIPVRVLLYADDCVYSSPIATLPIARFFTHLIHWMWIFDFVTGETVPQVYARHGLSRCLHGGFGLTAGLAEVLTTFSLERKLAQMRRGAAMLPLVFVGNGASAGSWRERCCHSLNQGPHDWRLHGYAMRDGSLSPAWGAGTGPLYCNALLGPNVQLSSLYNLRFCDLSLTGTVQLVADPHNELARAGFLPWEDFVPFDAPETFPELVATLLPQRELLARIAASAHAKASKFITASTVGRHMETIYAEVASGVR